MDVYIIQKKFKMEQYNIYTGLKGNFEGLSYQYTTISNSLEEAKSEAREAAREDFKYIAELQGLTTKQDCIKDYCRIYNLDENELSKEDFITIDELYIAEEESQILFKAVPTEEDNIDKDDLILGYVRIEDDSLSQVDSK